MKMALIRAGDGLVENIIEYDPDGDYKTPDGRILVICPVECNPGDTWDGEKILKTQEAMTRSTMPITINPLQTQIDSLRTEINYLKREIVALQLDK